jgi:putative phage-type endonuclease
MAVAWISTVRMTHEEWLIERRNGIGGSDAGAIVGLNKYRNAFDVYADKLGLIEPQEDSEAMRQGRDLEEYVAQRFCEETGKKVRRRNAILRCTEYPFAHANVDRLIIGENAGLECKTANVLSLKRYKNGEFPPEYYCQCMHYMAVTGYEKWYLAVLVFGTEFKIFEIKRDEEDIAALMNAEREFWEQNVLAREPPAPTGTEQNDRTLSVMFPESGGEIQLVGFDSDLVRLGEVKGLISKLETEKKEIEQRIKLFMGSAAKAESERFRVTWSNVERNTIDTNGIIKDFLSDKDLSEYTKTTSYRTLRVKEFKEAQ